MMRATPEQISNFKAKLLHPIPASSFKKVIECLFTYDLPVKVSEIWPYLIDTSKMNFEMGFPPREEREKDGETYVTTKTLGRSEEWIEKPWIWVHEKEIQQHRIFLKGWMSRHRGIFSVEETGPESTRVFIYFRWGFRNAFSFMLFKFVPSALEKSFAKFFEEKTKVIREGRKEKFKKVPLNVGRTDSYTTIRDYFLVADPLDLDRIHVKEIAGRFGLELQDVSSSCLRMVKDGELALSWDVICPHCRGARAETTSISGLTGSGECGPCGTTFTTDAQESVEVVFHLTPKLRDIPKVVYCAAEPAKKKHIKLYQGLGPGVSKTYQMKLPPGMYRLRRKNETDAIYLDLSDQDGEKFLSWDGSDSRRRKISTQFELTLKNLSSEKDFITLEEAWWFNDRLLSGEALSNPLIRDIFSEDHLQTGLKLNVGNQVILFTDIVGSTPFYKNSGDAVALKYVQIHYKEVSELITRHQGVVVKYIGDAIMAAFLDLEKAMACTIAIHKLYNQDRADNPIRLRASFHEGKVLCANMNVGLDYFGNTVNQAAKIQKYAEALEIAVTDEDWAKLSRQFPQVKVKQSVRDEKLAVDIKILSL
jgi:class 3 adenylate cyclase